MRFVDALRSDARRDSLRRVRRKSSPLRVLVTGGPTRAYLDRVRFLSNVSTGEVAFHLCRELKRRGAVVFAVCGPSAFDFSSLRLEGLREVQTNDEMRRAVLSACRDFRPDVAIFSAAVLDFAPARMRAGKVKSRDGTWSLVLRPTPKIVDEVARKHPAIRRFGFKLEWRRPRGTTPERLADRLRRRQGLEGLCLNFLSEIGARSHPATLCFSDGRFRSVGTKRGIASAISSYVCSA